MGMEMPVQMVMHAPLVFVGMGVKMPVRMTVRVRVLLL
jgi:hypothetical protein